MSIHYQRSQKLQQNLRKYFIAHMIADELLVRFWQAAGFVFKNFRNKSNNGLFLGPTYLYDLVFYINDYLVSWFYVKHTVHIILINISTNICT